MSEFKKWFNIDDHDWYNYPEEMAEACFNAGVESSRPSSWVSVSERLPEIAEEVSVLRADGVVTALARFIRYEEDEDYFWDNSYGGGNCHRSIGITHWMPLPEPPTGELTDKDKDND